jgi:hypothetical protein
MMECELCIFIKILIYLYTHLKQGDFTLSNRQRICFSVYTHSRKNWFSAEKWVVEIELQFPAALCTPCLTQLLLYARFWYQYWSRAVDFSCPWALKPLLGPLCPLGPFKEHWMHCWSQNWPNWDPHNISWLY